MKNPESGAQKITVDSADMELNLIRPVSFNGPVNKGTKLEKAERYTHPARDFSTAGKLSELYEMIEQEGEVFTSTGVAMTAKEIIDLIKIGALGMISNNGQLRETAKQIINSGDFSLASCWEDLITMVMAQRAGIQGSQKLYTPKEINDLIKQAEEGDAEAVKQLPKAVRQKVSELLNY